MTNKELANYVSNFLDQERGQKAEVAKKLGITRQGLNKALQKSNFSLDDANRILNTIGYELNIKIKILKK